MSYLDYLFPIIWVDGLPVNYLDKLSAFPILTNENYTRSWTVTWNVDFFISHIPGALYLENSAN